MPDWIAEAVRRARDGDPEAVALVLQAFPHWRSGREHRPACSRTTSPTAFSLILDDGANADDIFRPKRPGRRREDKRDIMLATEVALYRRDKKKGETLDDAFAHVAQQHAAEGVTKGIVEEAWRVLGRTAKARIKNWVETPS